MKTRRNKSSNKTVNKSKTSSFPAPAVKHSSKSSKLTPLEVANKILFSTSADGLNSSSKDSSAAVDKNKTLKPRYPDNVAKRIVESFEKSKMDNPSLNFGFLGKTTGQQPQPRPEAPQKVSSFRFKGPPSQQPTKTGPFDGMSMEEVAAALAPHLKSYAPQESSAPYRQNSFPAHQSSTPNGSFQSPFYPQPFGSTPKPVNNFQPGQQSQNFNPLPQFSQPWSQQPQSAGNPQQPVYIVVPESQGQTGLQRSSGRVSKDVKAIDNITQMVFQLREKSMAVADFESSFQLYFIQQLMEKGFLTLASKSPELEKALQSSFLSLAQISKRIDDPNNSVPPQFSFLEIKDLVRDLPAVTQPFSSSGTGNSGAKGAKSTWGGLCRSFNLDGFCKAKNCSYRHSCKFCKENYDTFRSHSELGCEFKSTPAKADGQRGQHSSGAGKSSIPSADFVAQVYRHYQQQSGNL